MRQGVLGRMQQIARRRGGRCLSVEYRRSTDHLLWSCRKGHEWHAKPSDIVSGRWCPECSVHSPGPMLSLEEMQRMAELRGCASLSTTYHNSQTPMHWRCARGHEWDAGGFRS